MQMKKVFFLKNFLKKHEKTWKITVFRVILLSASKFFRQICLYNVSEVFYETNLQPQIKKEYRVKTEISAGNVKIFFWFNIYIRQSK